MFYFILFIALYNGLTSGVSLNDVPTHLVGKDKDIKIWSRYSQGKTSYIHKNLKLNGDNQIESSLDFLKKYSSYFGLKESNFEFKKLRETRLPSESKVSSIEEYQTYLYGRRVFRGEIKVGKNSDGDTIHAHGHPLPESHIFTHNTYKHLKTKDIAQPTLSYKEIKDKGSLKGAVIQQLLTKTYQDILADDKKLSSKSTSTSTSTTGGTGNLELLSELKSIIESNVEVTPLKAGRMRKATQTSTIDHFDDVDDVTLVWYRPTVHGLTINEKPHLAYEIKAKVRKVKDKSKSIPTKINSRSDKDRQLDVAINMDITAYIDSHTGSVLELVDRRSGIKGVTTFISSHPNPETNQKEKEVTVNLRKEAIQRKLSTIDQPDITLVPVRVLNCNTPGYNADDCDCADENPNACTVLYDTTKQSASNSDLEAYSGPMPEETKLIVYTTVQFSLYLKSITNGIRTAPWAETGSGQSNEGKTFDAHIGLSIANAYYTEDSIFFGGGYETDDVVAHEWAHGLTDYDNSLVYMYESGALNEAYSDIIGESIDIENEVFVQDDRMTIPRATNPPACVNGNSDSNTIPATDNSERYVIGEEVLGSSEGGIRDMYYPECFDAPGSMDSLSYNCDTTIDGFMYYFAEYSSYIGPDNYWVHVHSGIKNHLFAMLQNGYIKDTTIVNRVNATKLQRLFYETSLRLNFDSSFEDYASTLNSTCKDLNDQNTPLYIADLQTGQSTLLNDVMNDTDCEAVASGLIATQMNVANSYCGLDVQVKPSLVAPLCELSEFWKNSLYDELFYPAIGWSCDYDSSTGQPSIPIDPCQKFGAWNGIFCTPTTDGTEAVVNGINLSNNMLGINATGNVIQGFPDLTPFKDSLELLFLYLNQIQTAFPNEMFKQMSKLKYVNLEYHAFTGPLDDDLFDYLPDLIYFDYTYGGIYEQPNAPSVLYTNSPFPSSYCNYPDNQVNGYFVGVVFEGCIPACAASQYTYLDPRNEYCGSSNDDDDEDNTAIIASVAVVAGLIMGGVGLYFANNGGSCSHTKREPSMNINAGIANSSGDGNVPTVRATRL